MKNKEISLSRWLKIYWIGMFSILTVIYVLMQMFMLKLLTKRAEANIQKMIYSAANGIEASLEIADDFIYEALYNVGTQSPSVLYNTLKHETDPVKKAEARNRMLSSMQSVTTWSEMVDFVLLYTDREDGGEWLEIGKSDNYPERLEVKRDIMREIQEGRIRNHGRYTVHRGEKTNTILRMIRIDGSFLFIGVSGSEIQKALKKGVSMKDSIVFAADGDGGIIFWDAPAQEKDPLQTDVQNAVLNPSNEGTYICIDQSQYLQSGHVSERSGLYFGALTKREAILEDMWVFRSSFLILFVALILIVPVSFFVITRSITKPIERVSMALRQISMEDPDLIMEEKSGFSELSHFVQAFNTMIAGIRKLRIEKYEVRIAQQRATMNYLQLQIKPHFYANVLNIIHSLAEKRDYEKIQKISRSFVNYARYMFQDAGELVELSRELAHVKDYMEIQKIRYVDQVHCELDVPECLTGALIPPFIIQSFVENSIKYAFTTKNRCNILVRIRRDESGENLILFIRDSGKGYDEETLQLDWESKNEEGHIGLTNVYRRLKLIYQDRASIAIWNEFGAVTKITLPYIAVDDPDFDCDDPDSV